MQLLLIGLLPVGRRSVQNLKPALEFEQNVCTSRDQASFFNKLFEGVLDRVSEVIILPEMHGSATGGLIFSQ